MGKQIYLERIEKLFEKSPVVDFRSIERIINTKKKKKYAKLLVHNLLKKEKIKRIGKGYYTKHDESSLSVFSFKPAYLGLQTALSFYGLWEQETVPVILTTKKVRRGIRKILESNIFIRNININHFFGFSLLKEGDFYLPYSDLEKTLIDMFAFNQKIEKETLNKIKKRINKHRLETYLKRYPPNLRNKIKKEINNKS